ncbi:MAG TPA: DUF488 domain-containing protein [Gemmatimonadales bacterium]|nr:DUF488 domain-containing protein [Gemmatimonadales bacterium]
MAVRSSRRQRQRGAVYLKRAYEPPAPDDGQRFLVERLWPRGVRKVGLHLDGWLKEVAPSPALRQWFSHDPEKWPTFKRRYFDELRANEEALAPLRDAASKGPVTLVYGARDTEHNAAVALREYLAGRR